MSARLGTERTKSDTLLASLRAAGGRSAKYRRGDLLLDPASQPGRVGILCDGSATVWRVSPGGKQLAAAALGAGDWFENIFDASISDRAFIEADAPTTIAWLDPASFERLVRREPAFAMELIRAQARRLGTLEARNAQIALDNVAGSVALAILQMAERQGSTDIRVTHEELAQRLGTVRESVSLAICKLRSLGVLAPAGRRKRLISILNLTKLDQLVRMTVVVN